MIEIIHYEKANKNKVIGYVDIRIPKWNNMIIRKIAHLQSGERKWFNLPSFSRELPTGEPQYLKFFQFEAELHNDQILNLLHSKVNEYCEKNQIEQIQPLDFETSLSMSDIELPF